MNRLRRVPLRGWLLLILCFAACGAVFSFTYLQHLEVSHEAHGHNRAALLHSSQHGLPDVLQELP